MPRPRFSEILYNKRRQLGLTIPQAAKVLKLRESVLVAFEEGDFASIPKSGYAQGMLSSYARYLGLNPREIVAQFQNDLYEFENGLAQASGVSYEMPGENRSYPINYNDDSMLQKPTVLGANEGFSTTKAYERSQRYAQSSPLVNPYGTTQSPRPADANNYYGQNGYPQARPYTSRNPQAYTSKLTRSYSSNRALPASGASTPEVEYGDRVVRRDFDKSQYQDDLTYNDNLQPFEAAYTTAGRRGSRNIASTQRPNVARRNDYSSRRELRQRNSHKPPQRDGFIGFLQAWFSDPHYRSITIIVALIVTLVLVITFAFKSCVNENTQTPNHPVVAEKKPMTDEEKKAQEEAAQKAAQEAEADANKNKKQDDATQVKVKVSVADGEVAWLEINLDGESVLAETVTGPWSKEFDVTKNINISTNKADLVTVEKNGEAVEFDKKSGGLGDLKIDGPKKKSETSTETPEEAPASEEGAPAEAPSE